MRARLDVLFADYAEHHRSAGNQWCHSVGIPLIAFGTLGLTSLPLFAVRGWAVEAALLLIALMAPVYLGLDLRLGLALTAVYVLLYLGARHVPWQWNLGLFALGWVFQFIGHGVYEKRSPAFFKNLAHLLVGPMWVLNHFIPLKAIPGPRSSQ
ncbi:MAG TPA: Mpo1-like protein [Candidatus Xenobia bacterium]|nr:Mpo1-like protein [Candidatus Xenobia bacterium]